MRDDFPKENPGERGDETRYGGAGVFVGRRRRTCSPALRLLFAITLIAAGTLLFLGNLGFWPARDLWDYWPILLIAFGVARLIGGRSPSGTVFGILLIAFGTLFLTLNLGIIHINRHDDSWPLSLLLIAFGVVALMRVLESEKTGRPVLGFPAPPVSTNNFPRAWAIFAEVKRKIETANFEGGELLSVFGNVDLNLRRAQISSVDKSVTIEANAVFGGVKIRVPDNWRVQLQGTAVLGSYSDKTTPPPAADSTTPVLTITGFAVFGAVEIED